MDDPKQIIEAARAYAAQWADGYEEGEPISWRDRSLKNYDEDPVCALEALLGSACACGCGIMRCAYAEAGLHLPGDYSPPDVPRALVAYVEALVGQYEAVTGVKRG